MSDYSFLVVTLIANSQSFALSNELVKKISSTIGSEQLRFLSPRIACDFLLTGNNVTEDMVYQKLQETVGHAPIDIVLQKIKAITKDAAAITMYTEDKKSGFFSSLRRKKLLLADMDSTLIEQECINELAIRVGLYKKISELTKRAMNGEINFETALRKRVFLLKGLSLSILEDVAEKSLSLVAGGTALVQTMRVNGAYTALVSGGFSFFAKKVAAKIGFDEETSNILDHDGEKLTGHVKEPILGREAKKQKLINLCKQKSISISQTLAVGDGANDLDMLLNAGMGVAFHAKPTVAISAPIRIDHADLSALLYIQGYNSAEFYKAEDISNIIDKK